jgi:Flp pilus assembly protein TadD
MRLIWGLLVAGLVLAGPGLGEAASRESVRHNNFGGDLVKQGKLDEALLEFQQAVTLDPSHAAAQVNLAFTYDRLNRTDEAIAAYKKSAELDPRNSTVYSNLGVLYDKRGLHDEAIASFEEALRIDPANATAIKNLETSKKNKGILAEGQDRIAKARQQVEMRPRDPRAASELGRVYASFGKKDEAFEWLAKAIGLGYDNFRFLKEDPVLATLRDDPRFAELLKGR